MLRGLHKKVNNHLDDKTYYMKEEKLQEKIRYAKLMFYLYAFVALAAIIFGGYITSDLANVLLSLDVSSGTFVMMAFGLFSVLNFFLIMFLWLSNESGYYKNMQLLYEIILYLRENK